MLTRNFYQYLSALVERFYTETVTIVIDLKNYDGSDFKKEYYYNTNLPRSFLGGMITPKCQALGSEGTWFGSGTSPATVDDYTLEAPYKNGELTVQAGSLPTGTHNDAFYSISTTYNVTNTTNADLTVSEIGIFARHVSTGEYYPLLDRTVLDTPVTVPAKSTVSLEYVIKFPYGT